MGSRWAARRDRRRAARARPLLDQTTPGRRGTRVLSTDPLPVQDQPPPPPPPVRTRPVQIGTAGHGDTPSPWRLSVLRDITGQLLDVYTHTRTYPTRQLSPTELDGLTLLPPAERMTVAELAVAVRQHGLRLVVTVEPA